jgi:hypothetical protein
MKILITAQHGRPMADKAPVAESLWQDVDVPSDWGSRNCCRRSKKETMAGVMS